MGENSIVDEEFSKYMFYLNKMKPKDTIPFFRENIKKCILKIKKKPF